VVSARAVAAAWRARCAQWRRFSARVGRRDRVAPGSGGQRGRRAACAPPSQLSMRVKLLAMLPAPSRCPQALFHVRQGHHRVLRRVQRRGGRVCIRAGRSAQRFGEWRSAALAAVGGWGAERGWQRPAAGPTPGWCRHAAARLAQRPLDGLCSPQARVDLGAPLTTVVAVGCGAAAPLCPCAGLC
jgi:hypothetical protein